MEKLNLPTDKRCRGCLQPSKHQMHSLRFDYVKIRNNEYLLAEVYHQCTQLNIEQTNLLCDLICPKCFGQLRNFFQFRKMCIDSNNTLERNKSATIKAIKVENINVFEDYVESNDNGISSEEEYFNDELNTSNERHQIPSPEHLRMNGADTSEMDLLHTEYVKFDDQRNEEGSNDAGSKTKAKNKQEITRKQQLSEEESDDEDIEFEVN